MRRLKYFIFLILLFPLISFAHCPLCTAGAGIGALIAKELGMKSSAIGIFIGAFSVALGWWIYNLFQRKYNSLSSKYFFIVLIIFSLLSIVFPLKLYFYENDSFSLYLFGDYGSLFNRTYVYDKFLLSSIIGGLLILISPQISKKIIELRKGKKFSYQGLIITFILLVLFALIFQIWL